MAKRISFSGENLSLEEIVLHHVDTDDALASYFSAASGMRFAGYQSGELRKELSDRATELDRNSTLSLLAAVEAAFRIDYLQRCQQRKKDEVSRQFLDIYRERKAHASLEDDIFNVWKANTPGSAGLIGNLRAAFKFRHWMAHGRYWTPKHGQQYDYLTVYPLALQALTIFPLMAP